jgi:hypothetical protein
VSLAATPSNFQLSDFWTFLLKHSSS